MPNDYVWRAQYNSDWRFQHAVKFPYDSRTVAACGAWVGRGFWSLSTLPKCPVCVKWMKEEAPNGK